MRKRISGAIATLEQFCEPHREWIEFFNQHPESEIEEGPLVGDRQRHQEIVKDYQKVILVLRKCQRLLR